MQLSITSMDPIQNSSALPLYATQEKPKLSHQGNKQPFSETLFTFSSFVLRTEQTVFENNVCVLLLVAGLARAKSVPTKTYSNEVVTLW